MVSTINNPLKGVTNHLSCGAIHWNIYYFYVSICFSHTQQRSNNRRITLLVGKRHQMWGFFAFLPLLPTRTDFFHLNGAILPSQEIYVMTVAIHWNVSFFFSLFLPSSMWWVTKLSGVKLRRLEPRVSLTTTHHCSPSRSSFNLHRQFYILHVSIFFLLGFGWDGH